MHIISIVKIRGTEGYYCHKSGVTMSIRLTRLIDLDEIYAKDSS